MSTQTENRTFLKTMMRIISQIETATPIFLAFSAVSTSYSNSAKVYYC